MKTIRLGLTTLNVTPLCVGCWQLSPRFWGTVDEHEWSASLDAAKEAGINFIDTADAYGNGFAEEALGRYLRERGNRRDWIIATKFYWDWTTPRTGSVPDTCPNTARDYIIRAAEASLQRLGTDSVELYQLHAWNPLLRAEEVAGAVTRLQEAGKIRHFGVSNLNVEQMELLERWVRVETLQPKYNLLHRQPEAREFPYTLARGIGSLVYSPLERGLLGGHIGPESRFTDHRKEAPLFQPDSLRRLLPRLDAVKALAAELDLTLPQFAIRWVLTHPAVDVAIIGTKKPSHLTTLLDAAREPLPDGYWHAAADLMAQP